MSAPPALYGVDGAPLVLGPRLGSGGEGTVFAVSRDVVAKVYGSPPSAERVDKLEALVRARNDELAKVAAWPIALVKDARRAVAGFTMPRIDGHASLAIAMNPASRKARFPAANWAWLAHVAHNLAAAVETIHRAGVVLGDVNESNFLVEANALVRAIDVDSYQVRYYARVMTCDVGIPTHQPPELQGKRYHGLRRTVEHDRFGLAVLIFQLLFMGRHPWAGVREGPELSFETGEVIAKLPFAYGKDAARAAFRPPPNSVRLEWLTPQLATNFERAFAGKPSARPSAAEWRDALSEFERALTTCASSKSHRYIAERGACPWCEFERRGIFSFVAASSTFHAVTYLDVAAIERHLAEIPSLDARPFPIDPAVVPLVRGEPLPARLRSHVTAWRLSAIASALASGGVAFETHAVETGLVVAFAASALLYAVRPPLARIRAERRGALADAERAFEALSREWYRAADLSAFARTRDDLRRKLETYRALPAKFTHERARLETEKRIYQERWYLETFLLSEAKIAGIGRKRRETLAAYGIETARDVDELLPTAHVPGIGEAKRAILRMWVEALRRGFTYDPAKPLDPAIFGAMQARENRERSDLERELRGGPQALKLAVEQAIARRDAFVPELEAAARAIAKARSDLAETALG